MNGCLMRRVPDICALLVAVPLSAAPMLASAADAVAGKALFKQQCSVWHTAEPDDSGGAQGPSLSGVYGRRAATEPSFGYTRALQRSNLTWDEATLNRFLAAPTRIVPGTAMVGA